jgi:hypothetical protein
MHELTVELFRLLDTTSTSARRNIVQKAIEGLHHNQLDESFAPETLAGIERLRTQSPIPATSTFRPFSAARERRPSVGILDIIPEVRCLHCT